MTSFVIEIKKYIMTNAGRVLLLLLRIKDPNQSGKMHFLMGQSIMSDFVR